MLVLYVTASSNALSRHDYVDLNQSPKLHNTVSDKDNTHRPRVIDETSTCGDNVLPQQAPVSYSHQCSLHIQVPFPSYYEVASRPGETCVESSP